MHRGLINEQKHSLFFARVDLLHEHPRELKSNTGLQVLHNATVNLRAKWIISLQHEHEQYITARSKTLSLKHYGYRNKMVQATHIHTHRHTQVEACTHTHTHTHTGTHTHRHTECPPPPVPSAVGPQVCQ